MMEYDLGGAASLAGRYVWEFNNNYFLKCFLFRNILKYIFLFF
jgi:hypothetical protein